jgi:Family of unknown function (DUF5924)
MPHEPSAESTEPVPRRRLAGIGRKIWWLHSFGALSVGVSVMLFARAGLAYADKVLIALCGSWLIVFVSLRFIVGPANRRPDEHVVRKGVRLATNYIIKQFYQQMFFFLVPIYASSATWAFGSWNWWLAPILLVCAVLSTMDLVFDNFIMEHRFIASLMYGLALFGMTNVLVPLIMDVTHFEGLLAAAAMTPIAVALLSFSIKTVVAPQGALLTLAATMALVSGVWYGRALIPPAPMAMTEGAVGHGTRGSHECLPASKHVIPRSELDGLRCGSLLREPGGVKEDVVHVWKHGHTVVDRQTPERLDCDGPDVVVFRSYFDLRKVPDDPTGRWTCVTETVHGQLVGMRHFDVVGPARPGAASGSAAPRDRGAPARGSDAGPPRDAGAPARDAGTATAPRDGGRPGRDAGR